MQFYSVVIGFECSNILGGWLWYWLEWVDDEIVVRLQFSCFLNTYRVCNWWVNRNAKMKSLNGEKYSCYCFPSIISSEIFLILLRTFVKHKTTSGAKLRKSIFSLFWNRIIIIILFEQENEFVQPPRLWSYL